MESNTRKNIKDKFKNPPAFSRSFPFWAWNGELDTEEIRRQVRQMHEQGIGGFFMHSREGLETEYMGQKWNQCILAAIDEAKKLGMYAWLYDEDRWPSGTAGGKVTAGGDEYRCKGLTLEVCANYCEDYWKEKELLAVYAAKVNENDVFSLRRIYKEKEAANLKVDNIDKLEEGEVCLIARLEVSEPSEWFNNEAPPDNLNPETVRRFISLTHDQYYNLCGEEFGKTVPGIFTDEPSLADTHTKFPANRGWIPWTYEFTTYFKENRGYDPLDLIPYLYFNGEKSRKIRHDYWHTITIRYSESYAKVLGEWCEKHGLLFTGHFLQEDKLGLATRVNGAIMPLYEYEHIPGIDMLQERTEEFMTVKQCSSVAHQLGRKHVLSETYGCTGWEFTFEGQRYVGDWQYALGVNLRCQHLALYTIEGCRKRDYPPCFNYNTSWWKKNHVVEDYFARLGSVLEEGVPKQQILLLHPSSTAWSMLGTSPYGNPIRRYERDVPKVDEIGYAYNELIKDLCFHHFDMDLGDEIIMSKHATVEGSQLRVGKVNYATLIIPPIDTMLLSTYKLLKEFLDSGGRLIVMKPFATMLEGEERPEVSAFFQNPRCIIAEDSNDLLHILEASNIRTISIKDTYGNEETRCLSLQSTTGEDETLFIVNNDRIRGYDVKIELYRLGVVEEWNALTGEVFPVATSMNNGKLCFQATLGGADSKLYRILNKDVAPDTAKESASCYLGSKLPASKKILYEFPVKTPIRNTMENTFTLDRCQYRMGQEGWSEEKEVWEAQKEVREQLGMRPIHLNGLEQRYKWITKEHPKDGKPLELKFHFHIKELPTGSLSLAIEHPEYFTIHCNGKLVKNEPKHYLLDRSIKKVDLIGLCEGDNCLQLSCNYRNDMELEDCYLCGEFGVSRDRKIISMPKEIVIGDWTIQGFLHYAGSICYEYSFDFVETETRRIYLELEDYFATCIAVYVNDKPIDVPWKAVSNLDITAFLEIGENKLVIEVMGSPRNLFGPFHLSERKRNVTNDACFRATGAEYSSNYNVVSYGLFQPPRLYEDVM